MSPQTDAPSANVKGVRGTLCRSPVEYSIDFEWHALPQEIEPVIKTEGRRVGDDKKLNITVSEDPSFCLIEILVNNF